MNIYHFLEEDSIDFKKIQAIEDSTFLFNNLSRKKVQNPKNINITQSLINDICNNEMIPEKYKTKISKVISMIMETSSLNLHYSIEVIKEIDTEFEKGNPKFIIKHLGMKILFMAKTTLLSEDKMIISRINKFMDYVEAKAEFERENDDNISNLAFIIFGYNKLYKDNLYIGFAMHSYENELLKLLEQFRLLNYNRNKISSELRPEMNYRTLPSILFHYITILRTIINPGEGNINSKELRIRLEEKLSMIKNIIMTNPNLIKNIEEDIRMENYKFCNIFLTPYKKVMVTHEYFRYLLIDIIFNSLPPIWLEDCNHDYCFTILSLETKLLICFQWNSKKDMKLNKSKQQFQKISEGIINAFSALTKPLTNDDILQNQIPKSSSISKLSIQKGNNPNTSFIKYIMRTKDVASKEFSIKFNGVLGTAYEWMNKNYEESLKNIPRTFKSTYLFGNISPNHGEYASLASENSIESGAQLQTSQNNNNNQRSIDSPSNQISSSSYDNPKQELLELLEKIKLLIFNQDLDNELTNVLNKNDFLTLHEDLLMHANKIYYFYLPKIYIYQQIVAKNINLNDEIAFITFENEIYTIIKGYIEIYINFPSVFIDTLKLINEKETIITHVKLMIYKILNGYTLDTYRASHYVQTLVDLLIDKSFSHYYQYQNMQCGETSILAIFLQVIAGTDDNDEFFEVIKLKSSEIIKNKKLESEEQQLKSIALELADPQIIEILPITFREILQKVLLKYPWESNKLDNSAIIKIKYISYCYFTFAFLAFDQMKILSSSYLSTRIYNLSGIKLFTDIEKHIIPMVSMLNETDCKRLSLFFIKIKNYKEQQTCRKSPFTCNKFLLSTLDAYNIGMLFNDLYSKKKLIRDNYLKELIEFLMNNSWIINELKRLKTHKNLFYLTIETDSDIVEQKFIEIKKINREYHHEHESSSSSKKRLLDSLNGSPPTIYNNKKILKFSEMIKQSYLIQNNIVSNQQILKNDWKDFPKFMKFSEYKPGLIDLEIYNDILKVIELLQELIQIFKKCNYDLNEIEALHYPNLKSSCKIIFDNHENINEFYNICKCFKNDMKILQQKHVELKFKLEYIEQYSNLSRYKPQQRNQSNRLIFV